MVFLFQENAGEGSGSGEDEDEEESGSTSNTDDSRASEQPVPARPSILLVAFNFVTTFFTSLIPGEPGAV